MKQFLSLNTNSAEFIIDKLIEENKSFKVSSTGYTTMIEYNNKKMFCHEPTLSGNKKNILQYRAKILSQINKNDLHFDFVPKSKIRYFELGKSLKESVKGTMYNYDISAAYPSALKKLGIIDEKLLSELMKLDKVSRLKAIGAIATRKTVTEFINGIPQEAKIKENKTGRDIFFLLCYEIGEIMWEIQQNINSFLFFWFDGVYFTDISEKEKINEIIIKNGYSAKFEELKEFNVKIDENSDRIKITYLKENKKKFFNLPMNLKINKF